jgi:hypothetical protein
MLGLRPHLPLPLYAKGVGFYMEDLISYAST